MGLGDILLFIFDFEHCANDLISGAWSSFFFDRNCNERLPAYSR
jgi:hypothetical protein